MDDPAPDALTPTPIPPPDPSSMRGPIEDFIDAAIAAGEEPACPICAYNLRHLNGSACPECGRALKLSLAAAEPFRGPWVFSMISLGIGAGLGVFSMLGIYDMLRYWGHTNLRGEERWILLSMFLYAACVPGLFLLWGLRRRFLALPTGGQRGVAATVFALVPGSILINLIWILSQL